MGDKSKIEWTDATWNAIRAKHIVTDARGWFCIKIAAACKNCYAEKMNLWRGNGVRYASDQQSKVELYLDGKALLAPRFWKQPRMVFVCSMTDLFADFVPEWWITEIYNIMDAVRQHTYQVLTKRPARRRQFLEKRYADRSPAPHIWEGVSAGNQEEADLVVPELLNTPAAVRWISAEPLLGPIELQEYGPEVSFSWLTGFDGTDPAIPGIDWVVVGGESGPGARPCHLEHVRSIVEQCKTARIPVFVKQLGSVPRGRGPFRIDRNDRKGGNIDNFPPDLQIREYPELALVHG